MHSGRYCYTPIKIKLVNAISFLPRAAGPDCKHQTASLQKTCWFSLFKASPHLPIPNSISTPVFIQNAFSLTVANYILIHEAHFIEEIVWLVWDWHWVTAAQKAGKQKWEMMKAVVCCSLFLPFFLSCWWKLAEIQESQRWLRAVEILCRLGSIQPFSLFNLSSLTSWKIEISPHWIELYFALIQKTVCVCISWRRITTTLQQRDRVVKQHPAHFKTILSLFRLEIAGNNMMYFHWSGSY